MSDGGREMEKTGGAEWPGETLRTSKMLFGRLPFDRLAALSIRLCNEVLFGVVEDGDCRAVVAVVDSAVVVVVVVVVRSVVVSIGDFRKTPSPNFVLNGWTSSPSSTHSISSSSSSWADVIKLILFVIYEFL
jgi:hypothetical protein